MTNWFVFSESGEILTDSYASKEEAEKELLYGNYEDSDYVDGLENV